jgi:hypothetical protein
MVTLLLEDRDTLEQKMTELGEAVSPSPNFRCSEHVGNPYVGAQALADNFP